MNILLLSYGNCKYDGRLRELIKVCKQLGDLTYITSLDVEEEAMDASHKVWVKKHAWSYLAFLFFCVSEARKLQSIDILLVDNRRAVVPAIFVRKICKPKYIVQDMRELYIIKEVKHYVGKIGCVFENYFMNKTDLLICANEQRAIIMQDHYNLKTRPVVYENFRMLTYSTDVDMKSLAERFDPLTEGDSFKLISTSGCLVSRTNDKLVLSLLSLHGKTSLYLVGDSPEKDVWTIRQLVEREKIDGVHIIGRLNENELKYLISRCDVGIVNYGQQDTNNVYCASGKIYEFLFENKPVVTTNNPPLKVFCSEYKVGVASDDYASAINKLRDEYDLYLERVRKFVLMTDTEKNNKELASCIAENYRRHSR